MTVAEFIEWLKTQDQSATVKLWVTKESGYAFARDFRLPQDAALYVVPPILLLKDGGTE